MLTRTGTLPGARSLPAVVALRIEVGLTLLQENGASSVLYCGRPLTSQEEFGSSLQEVVEAATNSRTRSMLSLRQVIVWVVSRGFASQFQFGLMSMQEVGAPLAAPSCSVLTLQEEVDSSS